MTPMRFFSFTTSANLSSLLQYNSQTGQVSSNVRLALLNRSGTGLFVVLNDGREAAGFFDWVRPQQQSMFVKFTRQFGTGG